MEKKLNLFQRVLKALGLYVVVEKVVEKTTTVKHVITYQSKAKKADGAVVNLTGIEVNKELGEIAFSIDAYLRYGDERKPLAISTDNLTLNKEGDYTYNFKIKQLWQKQ